MCLKWDWSIIKLSSFQSTNKACVSDNVIFLLFLVSQVGKSINDNTKNQVQYDNDNSKVKQQIEDNPIEKLKKIIKKTFFL